MFSLFVLLALYVGALFGAKNHARVVIILTTLAWHSLAYVYCAWIASYRFENPSARYVEIKNKRMRHILARPFTIGSVSSASPSDGRVNVIGLVLHILNATLFVLFEILLAMPPIASEPYLYTFTVGTHPRNYSHIGLELHSWNEILPAEISRAFAVAMSATVLVFVILFERQIKRHRQKTEKHTARSPRQKPFEQTQWHYPLYTALIAISVRQNRKKLKFWYHPDQLDKIRELVKSASPNATLEIQAKGGRMVSFTVIDTLNHHTTFTGWFTK